MTHPLTPREKPLGQVAYEGWAQGLPGCEWSNQTETQKRAWSKAADAILTALASGSGDHAKLARLADDLRKFEHHSVGSLKISMDEVRRIIAACDAHAALLAENAALRASLTKANDGFEEYERKFYLEQDAREEAERKLAEAVGLLIQARSWAPTTGPLGDKISAFLSKEAERG